MGGGVSINVLPNTPPENSAMLDVNNPTRGILIPRTTPNLITVPATGLIIYNTATNLLCYYDGNQWITLCSTSTGAVGASGSQTSVGMAIKKDNSGPDQSAILDITATDKGVLLPRLTNEQRDAILPVTGLILYNISSNDIEFFNGSAWYQLKKNLLASPAAGTQFPSPTQIVWNWNTVTNANGYKWNTTNDYSSATDMGTSTTTTETGLTCNTPYTRYIWAYSFCGVSIVTTLNQTTSDCGPSCSGTVTYGGETYNTLQIGTQCWMKENLNIGTRINGSQEQTDNIVIEKYCYNDLDSNCNIFGGLYQWNELMQYVTIEGAQGLCPTGWHLPTHAEWSILTVYLGNMLIAGGKMKSTGTLEAGTGLWYSPKTVRLMTASSTTMREMVITCFMIEGF